MSIAKIASALTVAGLLTGGGAAILLGSASAEASGAPATARLATHSAAPAKPATSAKTATPVTSVPPVSARPAAPTAAAKFSTWMDGTGGTVMVTDLGVLSQAKSDAAARNVAALEADAGALVASGSASLADPPPSHAASWDAAFAAMVQAGQDLRAGSMSGAVAEAGIVEANITVFNSQAS
jgi:hypothetical protein